jgi:hypothetical protein
MAHWAELDENNIVLRVLVGDNNDPDEGYQWLIDNLGGRWLKTSYNTVAGVHKLDGEPFRGNYAGVGYTYREDLDAFIPPKIFDSWIFDEEKFGWKAPKNYPTDGKYYLWDEEDKNWIEFKGE